MSPSSFLLLLLLLRSEKFRDAYPRTSTLKNGPIFFCPHLDPNQATVHAKVTNIPTLVIFKKKQKQTLKFRQVSREILSKHYSTTTYIYYKVS